MNVSLSRSLCFEFSLRLVCVCVGFEWLKSFRFNGSVLVLFVLSSSSLWSLVVGHQAKQQSEKSNAAKAFALSASLCDLQLRGQRFIARTRSFTCEY